MYLPILMYHRLARSVTNNAYTLGVGDFEGHLQEIIQHGLTCLPVKEVVACFSGGVGEKKVALTFDDGHSSDFNLALPLLQQYGIKATFFITTDWLGWPGYLNREQLLALQRAGMSIQSHAKSHKFLDALSESAVHRELFLSKKKLEDILAEPVEYLSCPGGRYNRKVLRCACQIGYRALFTSAPHGIKNYIDMLVVGRRVMRYRSGLSELKSVLHPSELDLIWQRVAYLSKLILKKSMGNTLYYHIWERLMKNRS